MLNYSHDIVASHDFTYELTASASLSQPYSQPVANAYSDRIKGDRADNIEIAIAAYTVTTREALPIDWAETLWCGELFIKIQTSLT